MDSTQRRLFNAQFTQETYQNILHEITSSFPEQLDFRVAESPIFLNNVFLEKLNHVTNHIIEVISLPDFRPHTENAIPPRLRFENEGAHPQIMCIDFAICKSKDGTLEPQLIELQGFPSLFAYQYLLSQKLKKYYNLNNHFSPFFGGLTPNAYLERMNTFLNKPNQNTILLEVFPNSQKTRIDFKLTKHYWDIDTVCLTEIQDEKGRAFYFKNGEKKYIDRIYNRIIFDEIEQKHPNLLPKIFALKNLDVTWISNPNWFYRVSKYCMPLFSNPYIPYSQILSKIHHMPKDLENYVLKPLFSFAGGGVIIDLDLERLKSIKNPENYILQQKVVYDPFIINPEGNKIKAEVRLMYIWESEADRPQLLTSLARLSQGKMIGVDYNKNKNWVGGSICFCEY